MSDDKQEGQKTVVSFIVGLLIGGLLVWAFSGPAASAPKENDRNDDETEEVVEGEELEVTEEADEQKEEVAAPVATLPVGDGKVVVNNQAAGSVVTLTSATYPVSEGWIGVRDYQAGQLGGLLGVSRFSEAQGLVPSGVALQRATVAGKEYAVVVYTESGDRQFNLADDKQIDSVFATFTAQ
ncbi:hypothetical protein A3I99_04825 [Candidatus Kaiserbacteria bacterium RIFCSPLOWO2_02_FULL_45_11b]|uniref:Uncharacterized protein n=1 Tax=Candidatus Kaiserbacteria bacterium RIFCSPLOWO2_12_FULL_45_26 TaxID=1798525 RepID=A0A1F6FGV2_9BACT|nr:MAG: hypothetical protein A2929_00380 [Candidatus Kaiserbacteria bacterium RIFCSPLOWO2_01_FULL_45_25]OGG81500.1 MAG: hypothetical protein A3I99_04825 [Candidatus Kaiserbacteria bacterium RIFCSPLOWO2_02_FULL_45_11b]OGG85090.1 MAG: hypothetical protein A3G90_03450 [Candidatus Kaiserbacteria bacterium RIFCSPLOWO2_12_FULL_45_26]